MPYQTQAIQKPRQRRVSPWEPGSVLPPGGAQTNPPPGPPPGRTAGGFQQTTGGNAPVGAGAQPTTGSALSYNQKAGAAGLDATSRPGGAFQQVAPGGVGSAQNLPTTMQGSMPTLPAWTPGSDDAQTTTGPDSAPLTGGNQQEMGLNPWTSGLQSGWDPNATEGAQSDRDSKTGATDDRMDEIRDMMADIQANQQAGLEDTMYGIDADESRNARRAANINAEMGSSVGGGFAGGQIQSQLSGTVARAQARAQSDIQGLQVQQQLLDRMMQMAESENDRELQEWLQKKQDATAIALAEAWANTQLQIAGAGAHESDGSSATDDITSNSGDAWDLDQLEIGNPDNPDYQDWDAYSVEDWLGKLGNDYPLGNPNGLTRYDQATFAKWWLTTSQSLAGAGYTVEDLYDLERASLQYMSENGGSVPNVQQLIDWFEAGK